MLRNREVKITLDKKDKDKTVEEHRDDRPIEEKAEAILHKLGKYGVRAFGCVCVYVLLDTWRQVQVAEANNHN